MYNQSNFSSSIPYKYLSLFACLLVAVFPFSASSQVPQVEPLPGWIHGAAAGVVLDGEAVTYSSPVIAEIDGDEANGKEVAVVGSDAKLHIFRATGLELWKATLPNSACVGSKAFSSPAVGELFGDGVPYLVIGYGGFTTSKKRICSGGMMAFHGPTGEIHWNKNLKKFDRWRYKNEVGVFRENFSTVFGSPALADTNGNGKLEIGFGSWDRHIYLMNAKGKILWHYQAADTVWSSPAFANVDEDSNLEMIIGTDISENKSMKPPIKNGGYLYAFKTKVPRKIKRQIGRKRNILFRFIGSTQHVWKKWLNQTIFSSPVVADVLTDSPGEEVIVASGHYFPEGSNNKAGKWIKILRADTGKVLKTITTPACSASSVAVADIDDDGVLEIVALTNGAYAPGLRSTYLSAWDAENPDPIWQVEVEYAVPNLYFNSPVVADLDGNGSLEVVFAHNKKVRIYDAATGTELTCSGSCYEEDDLVLSSKGPMRATPAIGDIDGDGRYEIVIGGGLGGSRGALYAWTNFDEALGSSAGVGEPLAAPWPMHRGNAARTGHYGDK